MKELSIEEKAKRYDEALERAKKWYYATNADKMPTYASRIIKEIFPELVESEDERIRKAIIEFFELQDDNTTYSFVSKKDILAWLEKQKEHWSEEDDQHMSYCINAIASKDGWTFAEKVTEKHWIQSLKQRIKG